MLIAQSKQAAMGEMIANIAHQWRQPLSAVAAIVQDIEDAYEFEELTQEYLENSVKKTMQQIQYMSQTIDDFRNFFNPNKSKIDFNIKEKIDKTLGFLASSIKQYNIDIIQDIDENCSCNGYPNEFSQVILNIINNAKDAIKENTPDKPYIKISCERTAKEKNIIKISNNGGQIPQDKLQTIFQPYYTTKKDGTGLGLYMSKMIVERNLKGSIEIKNMENGVEFKIQI
jgi:signal transduction histidine kinase